MYPVLRLADMAVDVSYGYTASSTPDPVGPKFLRITDIAQERLDWDTVPYCAISESDKVKYTLSRGDIVIARTGATVGHSKTIGAAPEAVFASYLIRVRIAPEFNPAFVGYVVGSPDYKGFVLANAGGAAQPNANAKVLTSYLVPAPPLSTQRKIAAILSSYDDLVENNNRRIKLLEEMAQRIYRDWFVDFRYPGHEGVPLVDSVLGCIPAGWDVIPLGKVTMLAKGLSYSGRYLTADGRPMANLKCIAPDGGYRREGTKPYSGPCQSNHEVMPGDIIVANTDLTQAGNVIGAPALVPRRGFERGGLISHHLFSVRTHDKLGTAFLFESLKDDRFRSFARGRASGTTVLGLRTADCAAYPLLLPPSGLRDSYNALASDALSAAERLDDCRETAKTTRDLLLPRLISGDIDVDDLDIAIPEAAA